MRQIYPAMLIYAAMLLGLVSESTEVYADKGNPNLKNLNQPIELNAGSSPRMYVVFQHSTHKTVACRTCHHDGLPGNRYASCTGKGCHSLRGASERNPMSVYMAYHAQGTDRSCYGCHRALAGKYPGFRGCRPCHMTPQGRKAQAEARVNR